MMSLSAMMTRNATAESLGTKANLNGGLHHFAKAKHVIFCYMSGRSLSGGFVRPEAQTQGTPRQTDAREDRTDAVQQQRQRDGQPF